MVIDWLIIQEKTDERNNRSCCLGLPSLVQTTQCHNKVINNNSYFNDYFNNLWQKWCMSMGQNSINVRKWGHYRISTYHRVRQASRWLYLKNKLFFSIWGRVKQWLVCVVVFCSLIVSLCVSVWWHGAQASPWWHVLLCAAGVLGRSAGNVFFCFHLKSNRTKENTDMKIQKIIWNQWLPYDHKSLCHKRGRIFPVLEVLCFLPVP